MKSEVCVPPLEPAGFKGSTTCTRGDVASTVGVKNIECYQVFNRLFSSSLTFRVLYMHIAYGYIRRCIIERFCKIRRGGVKSINKDQVSKFFSVTTTDLLKCNRGKMTRHGCNQIFRLI